MIWFGCLPTRIAPSWGVGFKSNGERVSYVDWRANRLADIVAREAASKLVLDPGLREEFCLLDADILRRQVLGKLVPPPGLFGSEVAGAQRLSREY